MVRLDESRESLWMLTVAPTIWAAHFLFSYVTAAVYCARAGDPLAALTTVRVAIGVYTAVALLAIAAVGWRGYRAHRLRGGEPPHDADSPEDRHRFMGLATMLLAGLSAVAVVYAALVAVFVRSCQ